MRISTKRLALGAGMTALLFGGLAPLAHAGSEGPGPDGNVMCSTDTLAPITGGGGSEAGEGMIVVGATNGGAHDITCTFTASGLFTTERFVVQSINEWAITQGANTLECQQNVLMGSAPETGCTTSGANPAGTISPTAGDVTLTVYAATDSGSGQGGASVNAVIGSDSAGV